MSSVRTFPKSTNALRPCSTCKYHNKGHCKLFFYERGDKVSFSNIHDIRFDEKLCGPEGLFWSPPVDPDPDQIWYSDMFDVLI